MVCPICGGDKEKVVRIFRGQRYSGGKWLKSNIDTREVICDTCGRRYYTETRLSHAIEFRAATNSKEIRELT